MSKSQGIGTIETCAIFVDTYEDQKPHFFFVCNRCNDCEENGYIVETLRQCLIDVADHISAVHNLIWNGTIQNA